MTETITQMRLTPASEAFRIGEVVRIKRGPTKSPYQMIVGFDENDPTALIVHALDAPENGNRAARRARYRQRVVAERKAKRNA